MGMTDRWVSRGTLPVEGQLNLLEEGAQALGVELGPEERRKFGVYLEQLLLWNRKVNLISRRDERRIALQHFLDSLSVIPHLDLSPGIRVVDVGTGASFPGLPVKICRPGIFLTLLDSIHKKTLFLRKLVELLDLEGVEVVCARAEELALRLSLPLHYDWVLTRAVGKLDYLTRICFPLLRQGGCLVALKGEEVEEEIRQVQGIIEGYGGMITQKVGVVLPHSHRRRVFVFVKKGLVRLNGVNLKKGGPHGGTGVESGGSPRDGPGDVCGNPAGDRGVHFPEAGAGGHG